MTGKWKTKEDIQHYVDEHHPGGKITGVFVNTRTKTTFVCEKGHTWQTAPVNVYLSGSWCPRCSGHAERTKKEVQELIDHEHPGGEILDYINTVTKATFRCMKGHTWQATPISILSQGTWCRRCSGYAKKTKEEIQQYIDTKHPGGKIIGDYVNSITKTTFQCVKGHTWITSPVHIPEGVWCPTCAGVSKGTKEDVQRYIDVNHLGGQIIGDYVNGHTKTTFRCERGHTWDASPLNVMHGRTWCPLCYAFDKTLSESIEHVYNRYNLAGRGDLFRYTLSSIIDIAKCRGRSRKVVVKLSVTSGAKCHSTPSIGVKTRKDSLGDFLDIVKEIARQLPELLDDDFRTIVKNEIYKIERY